jgi:hypothetical protein
MWLEIVGLSGAYGLLRATLKRKHLNLKLAFLGPLAWLVGELGAFLVLTRTSQFNRSDMYVTVIASALACVFITKLIFDRLPAKQYSCPLCAENFGADQLNSDSELEHEPCGTRLKVIDGSVVQTDNPQSV